MARERVAVRLHKARMQRHLQEQDELFSTKRHYILESMQISLAYLFRKRRVAKLHAERLAKLQRIVDEQEEAKRLAAIERRLKLKQAESQRIEEERRLEKERQKALELEAAQAEAAKLAAKSKKQRGSITLR